ncbi:MAG: hypothetical protein EU539_05970 [Promethearchaeota archaeon]|nr:MAG: hypothetical protein EU539_05970 [Candidatus Lokiarchaeota archaeon]
MKKKVLITGPPRVGKSTLISRLISHYSLKGYGITGFLTPEVKVDNKRIGFDALEIQTNRKVKLARKGDYQTRFKLGRYRVFVNEFESFLSEFEFFKKNKMDLIILDEIGKMELFSTKFQNLIKSIFQSEIPIIATIGEKLQHPIKDFLLNLPEVILFHLNRQNQDKILQEIISVIS